MYKCSFYVALTDDYISCVNYFYVRETEIKYSQIIKITYQKNWEALEIIDNNRKRIFISKKNNNFEECTFIIMNNSMIKKIENYEIMQKKVRF